MCLGSLDRSNRIQALVPEARKMEVYCKERKPLGVIYGSIEQPYARRP